MHQFSALILTLTLNLAFAEGVYKEIDDTLYYFNPINERVGRSEATEYCHFLYMKLISLESAEENENILRALTDVYDGSIVENSTFWTSGASEGEDEPYIWKSTNELIDFTNFSDETSDGSSIILKANGTWTRDHDDDLHNFICERPLEACGCQKNEESADSRKTFQNCDRQQTEANGETSEAIEDGNLSESDKNIESFTAIQNPELTMMLTIRKTVPSS